MVAAAVGVGVAAGGMYSAHKQSAAAQAAARQQEKGADAGIAAERQRLEQNQQQFETIQKMFAPYMQAATGVSVNNLNPGQPVTYADLIDTSHGDYKPNEQLYRNSEGYRNAWDNFLKEHYQKFGVNPNNALGSNEYVVRDMLSKSFDMNKYNQDLLAPNTGAQPGGGQGGQSGGALGAQLNLLGLNGANAQGAAYDAIQNSPAMKALQSQGENRILANSSATGGLRGGNVQAALAQFSPSILSSLIDQQYQRLGGITQLGQNSVANTGAIMPNNASAIPDLYGQKAAASAGAQLAKPNYISPIMNGLGAYMGAGGSFGGFGGTGSGGSDSGLVASGYGVSSGQSTPGLNYDMFGNPQYTNMIF